MNIVHTVMLGVVVGRLEKVKDGVISRRVLEGVICSGISTIASIDLANLVD